MVLLESRSSSKNNTGFVEKLDKHNEKYWDVGTDMRKDPDVQTLSEEIFQD